LSDSAANPTKQNVAAGAIEVSQCWSNNSSSSWPLLVLGAAVAAATFAQTSVPPTLLDDGRRLAVQLKLEPIADGVLFQTAALERSNQSMGAVVHAGQDRDATLDDWANLHRALAGQTQIAIQRGSFSASAGYLTSQEGAYNKFESDYRAFMISRSRRVNRSAVYFDFVCDICHILWKRQLSHVKSESAQA
jgi:hypothetical protein